MSNMPSHTFQQVGDKMSVCIHCGCDETNPRFAFCPEVCINCGGFGFFRNEKTDKMQNCNLCPRIGLANAAYRLGIE